MKSLRLHVRARADLPASSGCDAFPLSPVQMSVDGVKHWHCVVSKQAGPLHCIHHPLHSATHEGHKHCGVMGEQHQTPSQLPATVNDQIDSLIMSSHLCVFCVIPDVKKKVEFVAQRCILRLLKRICLCWCSLSRCRRLEICRHSLKIVQSAQRKLCFRECLVMWLCSEIHPRKYSK